MNNADSLLLKRYLEGELDETEMHAFEKEALGDPFLSDAIDGYRNANTYPGQQLSILQRQLAARIMHQKENKDTFFFSWQRLSVAAVAGLLFILALILFWMKSRPVQHKVLPAKSVTRPI